MKGIFVILDGLSDLPHKALKGKTPLEVANTPNLDFFATRGEMGFMYPVRPAFIPESDEALVSIFGNDFATSLRGQLEAKGAGIEVGKGDLAVRVNFSTIDVGLGKGKYRIVDRRAGRTLSSKEVNTLVEAINSEIRLPCKFIFKSTLQHRAILVLKGGFSGEVSGNDLTYSQGRNLDPEKVVNCKSLDDSDDAQHSAAVLNEFISKAHEVLKKHKGNLNRVKRGLMPANFVLIRGPGVEIPKFKKYKGWMSVNYSPLDLGFASESGMRTYAFDYPKLSKLDFYSHLIQGLGKACKFAIKVLKKNHKDYNYMYVHFKEPDLAGHDNKPFEKLAMIEYIDDVFFGFLRKFCPSNKIKVLVSSDHTTSSKQKAHTADPVPVLFYDALPKVLKEKSFNEREARKGSLGRILGKELLKKVGFAK